MKLRRFSIMAICCLILAAGFFPVASVAAIPNQQTLQEKTTSFLNQYFDHDTISYSAQGTYQIIGSGDYTTTYRIPMIGYVREDNILKYTVNWDSIYVREIGTTNVYFKEIQNIVITSHSISPYGMQSDSSISLAGCTIKVYQKTENGYNIDCVYLEFTRAAWEGLIQPIGVNGGVAVIALLITGSTGGLGALPSAVLAATINAATDIYYETHQYDNGNIWFEIPYQMQSTYRFCKWGDNNDQWLNNYKAANINNWFYGPGSLIQRAGSQTDIYSPAYLKKA